MTKENWATFRNEDWYKNAGPLKQAVAELAYLYKRATLALGLGRNARPPKAK